MVYIFLCAFLMVSTWRFWSAKSIDFRNRQASRLFVLFAPILAAIWYFHRYVLFVIAVTYMISGVILQAHLCLPAPQSRAASCSAAGGTGAS